MSGEGKCVMPRQCDGGIPTDYADDLTPAEVREDIDDGLDEVKVVDTPTPTQFGTFAHEAYQVAADETFDDVDHNVPVIVTKPDGTQAQGYIDTLINDRVIIDYKTNYMPGWSVNDATRYGREHGQQVQEYVQSDGTPNDARGWVVATVPPESEEVRAAYAEALAEHEVGVKFSPGEDQASVMNAVSDAVSESELSQIGHSGSNDVVGE